MPCRQRQLQANLHPRAQRHCTQQKNVFGGKAKLWQLGLGQRGAAALEEAEEQAAFLSSENSKIHRAKQIKAGLSSHPRVCAQWLQSTGEQDGVGTASTAQPVERGCCRFVPFLLPAKDTAPTVSPLGCAIKGTQTHIYMCFSVGQQTHLIFCPDFFQGGEGKSETHDSCCHITLCSTDRCMQSPATPIRQYKVPK